MTRPWSVDSDHWWWRECDPSEADKVRNSIYGFTQQGKHGYYVFVRSFGQAGLFDTGRHIDSDPEALNDRHGSEIKPNKDCPL